MGAAILFNAKDCGTYCLLLSLKVGGAGLRDAGYAGSERGTKFFASNDIQCCCLELLPINCSCRSTLSLRKVCVMFR